MSTKRYSAVVMIFIITVAATLAVSQSRAFAQGPTVTPQGTPTAPEFTELFASTNRDVQNEQYVFSDNKTGQFCLYIKDKNGLVKELYCSPAKGDLLASWSPDGKLIAFAACEIQKLSGCELWVIGADGTNPRQLAQNYIPTALSRLTWSADGDIIFSASAKTPIKDLYKVNPVSGTVTQITHNTQENDKDPVQGANGKLYAACQKTDASGICIVNADGTTSMVYQIPEVILSMPDVCAKDGRLAFWVADSSGQTASIAYQNNLGGLSSIDAVFGPTWSSDCTHIIFTKPDDSGHLKLWIMKVDSTDVPVLLNVTGAVGSFQGLVPPTKTPTPQ